ncbi:GNAT family N-acetyltransferase [Albirhodobacter sp. R86504]|uniref:GNAT family N-acetyltransferase n=1 Tax=Albirhodobacter sp. R86504 TaxID=3093848 RepID=UPI003670AFAF
MGGRAEILTARLHLRPLAARDEPTACAALSDPAVAQWLSGLPHPHHPQDFRDFRARAKAGRVWAITLAPGAPIGPVGDPFLGVIALDPDLGYWLAPQAQGFGFAREAALGVLSMHFARGSADPVSSGYFVGNMRSRQVLTSLGFVALGGERAVFCRPRGKILPHVDMVLTKAAFDAQTERTRDADPAPQIAARPTNPLE